MFFNYKLLHDFVWCSMVCFMWRQTCTLHPEFLSLPSKRWQAHGISNQQPMRYLVGGFNHLETYESQVGWLFAIYGTIKHVQNHQPVCRFQVEWQLLYRDRLQSPILPLGQWMESMFTKSRTLIPSANSSVATVALKTSLVVFQITWFLVAYPRWLSILGCKP